jgi:hypothetical protein
VIVSVLGAVPVGLYVTEQVAVAPVPLSVQGDPVNVPVPLLANDTVPVGVTAVPGELSVTVAVHVTVPPMLIEDGEQVTLVMVVRDVTVMDAVPVLVA